MTLEDVNAPAFAASDREAWLAMVGKALKGADFTETLVSATEDGIAIQPLDERRPDAMPLARRQPLTPWTISQRLDDPDIDRALAQLIDDLDNGATGISLVADTCASAFGLGLALKDLSAVTSPLATAIAGKQVSLRIEAGRRSMAIVDSLRNAFGKSPMPTMHVGIDPFSAAAFGREAVDAGDIGEQFRQWQTSGIAGTLLNADGRPIHNAGGTEAEELAVMAAAVAAYLRLLDAQGIGPAETLAAISLCLCADQDQFAGVAKLRAARLIFARIAESCDVDPAVQPHLFVETSYRMLARRDAETNILRNVIAVFAAATGCADEISVLSHTLVHGIPDPLARRLARNTQCIPMLESHLDHVADPAAGAGGIEALTDALAARAWEIFGEIERGGGLAAAITEGRLATMLESSRKNRPYGPIVGTTIFASEEDPPVAVLGPPAPLAGGALRPVRRDEEEGR